VILDWAGTTLDYGCCAPAVVFTEVFKRQGVEISMDEAREPMGAHKKVHIRRISQNPDVAERWRGAHGRLPTEEDVVTMFKEFYAELKKKGFVIYPGKVTDADTFRIGTIGHVFPSDIRSLISAIEDSIYW
jgi:beta-phosphoglucomutase-like phosphatase (HAD superfamily)